MSPSTPCGTIVVLAGSDSSSFAEETLVADGTAARREPGKVLPQGASLGRYLVLSLVGSGGMGEVYAAYDPELDRKVAIKLLHAHASRGSSGSSGGEARLLREAQAMARLTHPHVITVHDVGTFEGQVFVAMEFVEGETLADWLEPLRPWAQVLDRFVAAGQGLAAAHRAGLIHRDFKPENVLLGSEGRVLVADFGLARGSGSAPASEPAPGSAPLPESLEDTLSAGLSSGSLDEQLTMTGALMGTPAYMSPEQHLRGAVDARSDQFSFCVALYEGLFRQRPFAGDTLAALSLAVCQGEVREPPATTEAGRVPFWLRRVVMRGLAHQPKNRYPSMDALLDEIDRRPKARRRWAWTGVALGSAGLALGLGYFMMAKARDPCGGVDQAMDGVWDAGRRTQLEQSMAATGLAYADDVVARVSASLDGYADEYLAAARDSCEATHVRHEQSDRLLDLRNICLAGRKHHLEQSVALLTEADDEIVERASAMVEALPSLAPCSDLDALAARVPPPEDPAIRAAVDELAVEVARVDAMRVAGKLKQAHAMAQDLVARTREVDYAPLRAEAVALQGRVEYGLDLPEAEATLKQAAAMALASGHDEVFVDAATVLMLSLNLREERHAEVALWTRLAEAELDRIDADDARRASFLASKAQALRQAEDTDAALAVVNEAIALRERSGAAGVEMASARLVKSTILFDMGDVAQAREFIRSTLDLYSETYGPDHPRTTGLLNNLAMTYLSTSDYALARAPMEEVVERRTRAVGPDNLSTIDARSNLGLVLIQLGELEEAERHLRHVYEVYSEQYGENSDVGECLANLSEVVEKQGRLDEARELVIKAGDIFQRADPEGWRYGMTLVALAAMDREAGDPESAVEKARRGLELVSAHMGPDHLRTNGVELELARAEVAAGYTRPARPRLERLIEAFSGANADALSRASARLWLARALLPDVGGARASATLARQDLEGTVGLDADVLRREVDDWLREHPGR